MMSAAMTRSVREDVKNSKNSILNTYGADLCGMHVLYVLQAGSESGTRVIPYERAAQLMLEAIVLT